MSIFCVAAIVSQSSSRVETLHSDALSFTQGEVKSLIQFPFEKVVEQACAVYDTACLDIFVNTGIVDKLAEPAVLDSGLNVRDIQTALDMDAIKLTVVLRILSSQGWLRETKEGTFALARPALELTRGSTGRMWELYVIFMSSLL